MHRLVRDPHEFLKRGLLLALPVAGVLGVTTPYLMDQPTFAILGLYLAVPFVAAPLIYRLSASTVVLPISIDDRHITFRSLLLVYLILQWLSIVVLLVSDLRPISYYLLVAAMVAIVFLQIVSFELSSLRKAGLLMESGLILLNVVWGLTFKYFYFFGRTDIFPHVWRIQLLLSEHRVVGFEVYEPHPLWHIQVAFETMLFGLDIPPRFIMFFTSGLLYFVCVIAVVTLANAALSSERTALVAGLLTASSSWVILYGSYSIPRSTVSFIFVPMLLAMYKRGYRSTLLVGLFSVGLVMYHTVSGVFIISIFAVLILVQGVVAPRNRFIQWTDAIVFTIVQLVYFLTIGFPTFARILDSLLGPGGGAQSPGNLLYPFAELINYLNYSVLIFLLFVALFASLSKYRLSRSDKVVVLSATILAPLSFPSPILLTSKAGSFNLLRFGEYTYPFISIAAAIGIVAVVRSSASDRWGIAFRGLRHLLSFRAFAILLVASGMFLAVSSDWTASDNPLVEREFYTFYMTSSEVDGLRQTSELSPGFVHSDAIACKHLKNTAYGGNCHIMEVNERSGEVFASSSSDLIAIRHRELNARALQLFETRSFVLQPSYANRVSYVYAGSPVWSDLRFRDKVYVSDSVVAYTG